MILTNADLDFLRSVGIVADAENFRLETLWLNWQRENLHRNFSPCRDCGAKTYEQHVLDCKHGAAMVFVDSTPDDDTDDSINNAPSAGWCGEPSHTTLEGIPVDGTVRALQKAGVPVTAEAWMNLQFAGRPPAVGQVDGEVLAMLPRWVRAVYDPNFEPADEED
jgi:hypothetical protein